ncbi:MAG: DUF72 domain-containing protein [Pseudobacter sp.]|uniref:DUF72 domain-containing protein n=1 Tax=Pseudobacter sp. TaxID=2045420 RepID=UPI003F7E4D1B
MAKGNIYIGTSGWHYKHWKGTFYPDNIKPDEQFAFYAEHFSTVEINNSFYKLPEPGTFTAWRRSAPRNFLFAVKASRYITHMVKLKANRQSFDKFFSRVVKLEEKLGPILFQLPPRWKVNTERLATFLSQLPTGHRYTFEFRDHTWYTREVLDLLKKWNCAFCIYHLERHLSPLEVTADFVYIRLHGPGNKYQGSYSSRALSTWAARCKKWLQQKKDVYIYFDNDQAGYATKDALLLAKKINE